MRPGAAQSWISQQRFTTPLALEQHMRKFVALVRFLAIFVVPLIFELSLAMPAQAQEWLPDIDVAGQPRRPIDGVSSSWWQWTVAFFSGSGGGGGAGFGAGFVGTGQSSGSQAQNRGGSGDTYVGDPINYATGNAYQSETDYKTAGSFPVVLARHFNSDDPNGPHEFGNNWRVGYSRSVSISGDGQTATVTRDDGQELKFTQSSGAWSPPVGSNYRLSQNGGGFTLITDHDETETYSSAGKLLSYANRAGLTISAAYDGQSRLSTVTDAYGRTLTFSYNGSLISQAQAPDGTVYTYGYDGSNRLASVTYPNGAQRQYHYDDFNYPNAVTAVYDENGSLFTSYGYDWYGRATSTQRAGGAEHYSIDYDSIGGGTVQVSTPVGGTERYTLTAINGIAKQTNKWTSCFFCNPNSIWGQSEWSAYDGQGNLTSYSDFNGNQTVVAYDTARNLPTSQTSASGTPIARTISTNWHPDFRLPTAIGDGERNFAFTYDVKGNLLTSTVSSPTSTSTSTYTYNWAGQVLTSTDPLGHVATYAYDGAGNLTSVTNALGQTVAYTSYDANGRPLTIQDANGVVTNLSYNFRGQVTSSVTQGQTTTYSYDAAGQLTQLQAPSGAVHYFTYDGAHRLIGVSDALGNRLAYTLDGAGNRTKEEAFDPSGALVRTHSRSYDGLNRLNQEFGASGQTSTVYYDSNDNVVGVEDPNGNGTTFAYDALNRAYVKAESVNIHSPDPNVMVFTRYTFDANGRLASVMDPRGLVTSYTYNAFDQRATISSPDTGATTKTFDAAGNVTTSTDARGQTTSYLYDGLNRLVRATHADGSIIAYGYDQGAYGVGRLTSMSDPSGTTSYAYDALGHVVQKTQTTGYVTLVTQWSYDAGSGRLVSVTYPSGSVVLYAYDANARVSAIGLQPPGQGPGTLIDQIAYSPFGAVASWRNSAFGGFYVRNFDQDGRISAIISSTGNTLSFAYDPAGRIVSIDESGRATKSFAYDTRDRLTGYGYGGTSILYAYDASGNRISDSSFSYTIDAGSNRLIGVAGGGGFSYDAAGGMTSNAGLYSLAYDARNRLAQTNVGALVTSYGVNGLGQRVSKNGPSSGPVEYAYDLSGRVIGIYGQSGAVREEIVWLGDLPIATRQNGSTFYIAPDHLGAPHEIVNSGNGQVWFWDHDPFGQGAPWSAAGFAHDLRFPGQVFDVETGLYNNGLRDYLPAAGRYVESDPIGLDGGINTYGYAANNPVSLIDPFGLDPKSKEKPEALPDIDIAGCLWCMLTSFFDFGKAAHDIRDDPWGVLQGGLDGLGPVGAVATGSIRVAGRLAAVVPSSRALGRALEAIGQARQARDAAHHIVAGSAAAAAPARATLQRLGIGINDAANGVFLRDAEHAGLHTAEYYSTVNNALANVATKAEAEQILQSIGQRLQSGGYP
jgi:RHS repeat-associated protein